MGWWLRVVAVCSFYSPLVLPPLDHGAAAKLGVNLHPSTAARAAVVHGGWVGGWVDGLVGALVGVLVVSSLWVVAVLFTFTVFYRPLRGATYHY